MDIIGVNEIKHNKFLIEYKFDIDIEDIEFIMNYFRLLNKKINSLHLKSKYVETPFGVYYGEILMDIGDI